MSQDGMRTGSEPKADDLIDRDLIALWLYWGLFWLMFAPSVGIMISTLFNFPDYLGDSLYLTFGRLRPIHVNGVIFGAFSTLFIGLCYYILPRLTGVRVYKEKWGYALAWLWNIGLIVGMISLLLGYNQCLEAGDLPLIHDIMIFSVSVALPGQLTMTVARRLTPATYVRLWEPVQSV